MDVKEYLQNPCGTLSIPYWKAKTLAIPDSMRIIHCSNWNGQYGNFQRFFRIKHDLNDLSPIDYDYDTLSIDYQATQLCEMINESYKHENIVVSEQTIFYKGIMPSEKVLDFPVDCNTLTGSVNL